MRIEPWWSNGDTTRLVLSEYFKYLFAKVRMRFDAVANGGRRASPCRRASPHSRGALTWTQTGFVSASFQSLSARSLLFNALFYVNMIVHMIVALPTLVLPYPILRAFCAPMRGRSLWLLRVVCGTKVEWRGREKLPAGACIVACKHQSLWETFALFALLPDPTYILKRELMWIPLFGWYTCKAGMIPIDRSAAHGGAVAHDGAGAPGARTLAPDRHLSRRHAAGARRRAAL